MLGTPGLPGLRAYLIAAAAAAAVAAGADPAAARPRWQTLPAVPAPPAPDATGDLAVDDFTLHYAVWGKGAPVVLLHGGLGNGDHFGAQIPALVDDRFQVITVDARGHGRSGRSAHGISYHLMAEDVIALLDHLGLDRAAVVGWSDGGIIGLDLAIHHPERLTRLFVLGTNYDASGLRHRGRNTTVDAYFARCKREHRKLSPVADQLGAIRAELRTMWRTQPRYQPDQLRAIEVPTAVALGDHDELIARGHAEAMAELIPDARLIVLPDASHFAMWQDPDGFNRAVLDFLAATAKPARVKPTPARPTPARPTRP